jgi:hypothetical protein
MLDLQALRNALSGPFVAFTAYKQFITFRLTWNAEKGKYDKIPLGSSTDSSTWLDWSTALALAEQQGLGVGFVFSEADPFFFLDIDGAHDGASWSPLASELCQQFSGCAVEVSASQSGLHIFGTYTGQAPEHRSRNAALRLELYHTGRFVALTGMGAVGSAAHAADAALAQVISDRFPPAAPGAIAALDWDAGPVDGWSGPTDDAELLATMRRSKPTPGFGGTAPAHVSHFLDMDIPALAKRFPPQTPGKPFDASAADMSFASTLAFWTGKDAARMVRILRASPMWRDKWEREEYQSSTIRAAIGSTPNVYTNVRAVAVDGALDRSIAPVPVVRSALIAAYSARMNPDTGRTPDMLYALAKEIAADNNVQREDKRGPIAENLKAAFQNCGVKYNTAAVREMVCPSTVRIADEYGWLQGWVFLTTGDQFYNPAYGEPISATAFNALFNRYIAPAEGKQPNAAKDAVDVLNIPVVSQRMYVPFYPLMFENRGIRCINSYRPESVPTGRVWSNQAESDAVTTVLSHLSTLLGDQYETFIAWIAHNVQKPGVRIRFAPLIKGTQGDGKSAITTLLKAVMGDENVTSISNAEVKSEFTDWAWNASIGVIEELRMEGDRRHAIANAAKTLITNDYTKIIPKGSKGFEVIATMNIAGYTNHEDAVPLDDDDRRWWVIFSPFKSYADIAQRLGDVEAYFDRLFHAINNYAPVLRHYFESYAIPAWFKPNGRAPDTAAKRAMMHAGDADLLTDARGLLDAGAPGVTSDVISSRHFFTSLATLRGDKPLHTRHAGKLMESLGFIRVAKTVRWNGDVQKLWTKPEITHDIEAMRKILDESIILSAGFGAV